MFRSTDDLPAAVEPRKNAGMQDNHHTPLQDKYTVLVIAEPGSVSDHVTEALAKDPKMHLLGPFELGVAGVTQLRKNHVDCVVLDIGMRSENALVSLNRILKVDKATKVLMASTLSFANVKKSLTGFDHGAADFVQIPADFSKLKSRSEFDSRIRRVTLALSQARRADGVREIINKPPQPTPPSEQPSLRPFIQFKPAVIAIASSTGGPQALYEVLNGINADFDVPILITQHMPKTFTNVLATNLAKRTSKTVVEAKDGDIITPGCIYIAPGDFHMEVGLSGGQKIVKLNQGPPVSFCRPSADPMLASIAKAYGSKVYTFVLTGMGSDGKQGASDVLDAGGQVIAQDFATSTVWGMPGAVAKAGYCSKIEPLDKIAALINSLLRT